MTRFRLALIAALSTPSTAAFAGIYAGNPEVTIAVDRAETDMVEGLVRVDSVDVISCDQSVDSYEVDQIIDPVEGWSLIIDGGDICDIEVHWATEMSLESSAFELEWDKPSSLLHMDVSGEDTVALVPFTVVSGSISGGAPLLTLTID